MSRIPALGWIAFAAWAACADPVALTFPDTSHLHGFRALDREANAALFAQARGRDTLFLRLEWKGSQPWALTYAQNQEFDENWILQRLADVAPETAPNPLPDPAPESPEATLYPGLKQEWLLRGMRTTGWMGTGVHGMRFFVVFRAASPAVVDSGTVNLQLRPALAARLDTAAGWLAAPCSDRSPGKHRCYRPRDHGHFLVEVTDGPPPRIALTFEEGDPLTDVRSAAETLPDEQWPDYAKDLSSLLHGEAVRMLSQAAGLAPVFTWPAWKILDWKGGVVPPATYLAAWRATHRLSDPLPALRYRDHGLQVDVDLYLGGSCRITVQAVGS